MRSTSRLLCLVPVTLTLAGCMGALDDTTRSGFRAPAGGAIPVSLDNEYNESLTRAGVGTVAMVTGTDRDGAAAYAGIASGSNVGPLKTSGTAVMTGNYEVVAITGIYVIGTTLFGTQQNDAGAITLTADFDGDTLTGRSGNLVVDGDISGSDLAGNVTYRGTAGTLDGFIGRDAAIGAFQGNDDGMVYSGGFIVED